MTKNPSSKHEAAKAMDHICTLHSLLKMILIVNDKPLDGLDRSTLPIVGPHKTHSKKHRQTAAFCDPQKKEPIIRLSFPFDLFLGSAAFHRIANYFLAIKYKK